MAGGMPVRRARELAKEGSAVAEAVVKWGPGRGGRKAAVEAPRVFSSATRDPIRGWRAARSTKKLITGKRVALGVGAAYGAGAIMRRSGRGTDRTMGRPTGMYGF